MVSKTKITAAVITAIFLSAPLVHADSSATPSPSFMKGGSWHHEQREKMVAEILNLTDDQVKQLKDIHEKQKQAKKDLMEQIKAQHKALFAEIVKATPDMTKVNTIITQIKTLISQSIDDHLNSTLEIKKVLSPEQFAGYMALKEEEEMMEKKHHEHFGHKGDFGGNFVHPMMKQNDQDGDND